MKKVIAIILVSVLLLVGCGSGSSTGGLEPGDGEGIKDTIIFAQGADITSLDPHIGRQLRACTVSSNMFDTLTKFDSDMNIEPSIAESWERLSDLSVKFNIRKGIKFHNGDELTAEDVKYSLERAMASEHVGYTVSFIDNVEMEDDYTVIVNTEEPYGVILAALTSTTAGIVSKRAAMELGDDFALNPVGSGPFKLVEWKQGEYCKLEAFEDYYLGKPETQYVIMKVVPESTQRSILLETGEIDLAYELAPNDVGRVAGNDELTVFEGLSSKVIEVSLNCASKGPIGNKLVRQAVELAIDKDTLVENVVYGKGKPEVLPVTPALYGYIDYPEKNKYNIQKAKELLAQAGYADGFETSIFVENDQTFIELSQVIQNQLSEIGIKVDIEVMEYGTLLDLVYDGDEYEMWMTFWNTTVGDADRAVHSLFFSKHGGINDSRYSSDKMDELLMAQRTELDQEKRLEIFKEIYDLLAEDMPIVTLYAAYNLVGANKKVQGFQLSPEAYFKLRDVTVLK